MKYCNDHIATLNAKYVPFVYIAKGIAKVGIFTSFAALLGIVSGYLRLGAYLAHGITTGILAGLATVVFFKLGLDLLRIVAALPVLSRSLTIKYNSNRLIHVGAFFLGVYYFGSGAKLYSPHSASTRHFPSN